ncbi:hypothetical protein PV387_05515 [Streptomyces sp. ME02-6987-2C]|uniref:hypothetical protein n=1 Tax=unclassified Streptomyces TaxID=2593676 RepID=UPI0029A16AB6|nr:MULTISPECIES: hypothetical protein [unclassified Streptomyces]MDX3365489.1 hypothetical protein [Streptomyces sp. ME02-6987-2C]MDX3422605.1 hypothetical protein [Streptomyces sp. ME02-6985-2c]
MTRRNATQDFMAHNQAMMHTYCYQLAATWFELHPEATASELVAFLQDQANSAQTVAAEVYVAKEGMTMDEAMAFQSRHYNYRDLMRRELSANDRLSRDVS